MATRFYLHNTAAPDNALLVSPPFAGDWTTTTSATRTRLETAIDGSALANHTRAETAVTPVRALCQQFTTGPLNAQTISGTLEVAIRSNVTNVLANARLYVVAKVVSKDGATLRGVLYAGPHGINFTVATGVSTQGTMALTSVDALQGDRVVIELGILFDNTAATSWTGLLQVGTSTAGAVDIVNTNGVLAASNRPWAQFSTTLSFDTHAYSSGGVVEVLAEAGGVNVIQAGHVIEALGTQLPVVAAEASYHLEVMGRPKPVEAAFTAVLIEVLGVAGEPPAVSMLSFIDGAPVLCLFPGEGWVELDAIG